MMNNGMHNEGRLRWCRSIGFFVLRGLLQMILCAFFFSPLMYCAGDVEKRKKKKFRHVQKMVRHGNNSSRGHVRNGTFCRVAKKLGSKTRPFQLNGRVRQRKTLALEVINVCNGVFFFLPAEWRNRGFETQNFNQDGGLR